MDSITARLDAFNKQFPHFRDLEIVKDCYTNFRRCLLDLHLTIAEVEALGDLVCIWGSPYGDQVQLTAEGREYLSRAREAFDAI